MLLVLKARASFEYKARLYGFWNLVPSKAMKFASKRVLDQARQSNSKRSKRLLYRFMSGLTVLCCWYQA